MNTEFFCENGTGNIFDEQAQETPGYFEDKLFPLTARSSADTEMKEAELKKERVLQYNIYTLEDSALAALAALAANINYGIARKWKKTYKGRP
ncbi:hypothetical protein BY458DRAFT_552247 [Sporodiniella umbellata]|nr:hypothetical protein BY458DRAFT_552247 [Sporodiniella umbellata]